MKNLADTGKKIQSLTSPPGQCLSECTDVGEISVMGLSRNKKFLTVGGRKEHRIVEIKD
jgi:hypothetical protein